MVEFQRIRLVKKPKKVYECYICGKSITGEHNYTSGKYEGDFVVTREHIECSERAKDMCSDCPDRRDCQSRIVDCYYEKIIEKEKKHEG